MKPTITKLSGLFAALPLALALSGNLHAETVARYGISMADIPLTTGQPDRGAGAYQFTGHTLYDPLVAWEANVGNRPGKLVPGLATDWKADPKDSKKWVFHLRKGVKFHDGSEFTADAVIWNLDKVLADKSPQFDAKQSAQVRPRIPSIASYRKVGPYEVEIVTKETDALDAAAGAEPVLTGVTIGIRMTAGPILTNPGAPDISSEFLEAAGGSDARSFRSTSGRNATHGRLRESSTISMPFHGIFSMVYGFGMSPSATLIVCVLLLPLSLMSCGRGAMPALGFT